MTLHFTHTQDHPFLYIRKTIRGQDLDPAITNDGLLSFGLINGPLRTLDATMRYLFGSLVKEQSPKDWGRTTPEEKKELLVGMDVLSQVTSSILSHCPCYYPSSRHLTI